MCVIERECVCDRERECVCERERGGDRKSRGPLTEMRFKSWTVDPRLIEQKEDGGSMKKKD